MQAEKHNDATLKAVMDKLWWNLHCDNVPAHSACLIQDFMTIHCITQVSHPSDSSDLALSSFWLFRELKSLLKEKTFQTLDDIQEPVMRQLMVITKDDFAQCFKK